MHFCTETFYRKIFSYKERRKTHTHSLHKHLFVISYYIAYIQIQILLPIDYYSLPIDWIVVCMCVFVRLNSVSMECEQFFLISSAIRHTSTSVGLFWGGGDRDTKANHIETHSCPMKWRLFNAIGHNNMFRHNKNPQFAKGNSTKHNKQTNTTQHTINKQMTYNL